MKDRTALRERFLRFSLPIQLGNLASNLARIDAWSDDVRAQQIVEHLIDESKFFIEWAAPGAELEQQFALVDLQRRLVRWQFAWSEIWNDSARRAAVAAEARQWSNRILAMSGLLDAADNEISHLEPVAA
jgi:hypothetical protein